VKALIELDNYQGPKNSPLNHLDYLDVEYQPNNDFHINIGSAFKKGQDKA